MASFCESTKKESLLRATPNLFDDIAHLGEDGVEVLFAVRAEEVGIADPVEVDRSGLFPFDHFADGPDSDGAQYNKVTLIENLVALGNGLYTENVLHSCVGDGKDDVMQIHGRDSFRD